MDNVTAVLSGAKSKFAEAEMHRTARRAATHCNSQLSSGARKLHLWSAPVEQEKQPSLSYSAFYDPVKDASDRWP